MLKNLTPKGLSFLKEPSDLKALKKLYLECKDKYYNEGNSPLTDVQFDKLEDFLKESVPKWAPLHQTGIKPKVDAKLGKKFEIELPVPAPSLNKITSASPEAWRRWIAAVAKMYGDSFRVSEKLDGASIIATYKRGKLHLLATRGNGVVGKSILFLAPYLNIPQQVESQDVPELVIRFEAIMPTAVYQKKWAGHYDSARALASAVLNRHDAAPALKDLHFVALAVLKPSYGLTVGLNYLKDLGFRIVRGSEFGSNTLTPEKTLAMLESLKTTSKYECDGIVVCSSTPAKKWTSSKPDFSVAFKANEMESAQLTTIRSVMWKVSSFGTIVPKAVVDPISFGGVTVKRVAMHNAGWAIQNGLGVGAQVRVLRSGDIIPKIVKVVKTAKLSLPPSSIGVYQWDKTKTHIVLVKSENPDMVAGKFSRMFHALGLDKLSIGLAKKLVEAGYTTTSQVIAMTKEDFAKLPGVKSMAAKFADEMQRIRGGEFEIPILMIASGAFPKGVGRTRIRTLQDHDPKLLQRGTTVEQVSPIKGCGPVFARDFVSGLSGFWDWVEENSIAVKKPSAKKATVNGPLKGKLFTWTGYRSETEEARIQALGGTVSPWKSTTSVLFVSDSGKASSKASQAAQRGIPVTTFDKFIKKYG